MHHLFHNQWRWSLHMPFWQDPFSLCVTPLQFRLTDQRAWWLADVCRDAETIMPAATSISYTKGFIAPSEPQSGPSPPHSSPCLAVDSDSSSSASHHQLLIKAIKGISFLAFSINLAQLSSANSHIFFAWFLYQCVMLYREGFPASMCSTITIYLPK